MQYALKDYSLMGKEPLNLDPAFHSNDSDAIETLKKTNYSIVDLLPQNNLAVVRNSKMALEILKMVYNVISLLADCLHKFYVSKQYQYFDPHVGDTACQIRAYIFVLLSKKEYGKSAALEQIYFLNTILDKLTKIFQAPINYKNRRHTIVELLKKYGCYFSAKWHECFLYQSYYLTLFKMSNAKEVYICHDKIANFFEISKTPSKKMLYKYQIHLSAMSCEFIKTIALNLNINEKNSPNIISSILYDNDERNVYPCFFYSKMLFTHMQKTKCTVLLVLETINGNDSRKDLILFDGGATKGDLLIGKNSSIKEDVCVVVIGTRLADTPLASSELLEKLNYYGLYDILLMNMAAHPQFSGSKLISFANQLVPNIAKLTAAEKVIEAEFLTLKNDAHKYGFCWDNPSILLVKHIFMDAMKNQIDLHKNTNYISVREPVDI